MNDYDGKADADHGDCCMDVAMYRIVIKGLQLENAKLHAEVELAQSESRKARKRVAELSAEVDRLEEAVLAAYRKGHHHTVNGGYQWCDQGGREVVEEIIREAGEE